MLQVTEEALSQELVLRKSAIFCSCKVDRPYILNGSAFNTCLHVNQMEKI